LAAANNELWVGTDAGITRWDGTNLTRTGIPNLLNSVQVLTICTDRDGNVWIGTNSGGLMRLNAHGVSSLSELGQVPADAITALFEDREGNLWVGGAAGLVRLRDSPFISYSMPEGVSASGTSPVFVDGENRIWFAGNAGGLIRFRDGKSERVS